MNSIVLYCSVCKLIEVVRFDQDKDLQHSKCRYLPGVSVRQFVSVRDYMCL